MLSLQITAQEETLNLSLQEAIDYAIKNNTSAKNATLNIATAKKQKWETKLAANQ